MTEEIVTQCKIEGCLNNAHWQNLCNVHYLRLQRYGQLELRYIKSVGDTPAERFWSKVLLTANPNKCWLWQGSTNKHNGYGTLTVQKQGWLAHIYAWYLTYGIKPTTRLLHSCDVPQCVNPTHLREGSQAENIHDMMVKGRYYHGKRLTKMDVDNVLQLHKLGTNRNAISCSLDINYHIVIKIIKGIHWLLRLL